MSVDRFFSTERGRVCRVQRFYPALSTDPSLIVRFNSGFDHHFYSPFLPVKVSRSSDSSQTPPPCICMRELFSTLRSLIEHRNALNCFSEGGGLISSSPCKWMPMSKLGRWKVFFETKDFTCLKKGVERERILKNLILGIYIENILLYLR